MCVLCVCWSDLLWSCRCSDDSIVDDIGMSGPLMAADGGESSSGGGGTSTDDQEPVSPGTLVLFTVDAVSLRQASLLFEGSRGSAEAQLELATGAARTSLKACSWLLHSSRLGEVQQLSVAGVVCAVVPRSITATTVSVRTVNPTTGVATVHIGVSWDNLRCITAAYSQPLTDVSVIR